MKSASLVSLNFVLTLVFTLSSQVAGAFICEKETRAAMAKYGVKDAHLFWIDTRGQFNSLSHLFWYETKECGSGGYVCVTANENCHIDGVFTRYRCVVPGLRRWY